VLASKGPLSGPRGVADLADLKRVIDEIRRSGGIVGTKTLIVLGTTSGSSRQGA
jgi:hypothetical protein